MTDPAPHDPLTIGRLYGRSKGSPLSLRQRCLVDTLLPQIAVPTTGSVTVETAFNEPTPRATAANVPATSGSGTGGQAASRPLHFEIGFGGGEHLAERADMLPDHRFIGCEPFLNGIAQALVRIHGGAETAGLANVRLHHGDALNVLRRIPDGALSFVYLLHPDPWPKTRHIKRRMMNDGPINLIAQKLKPGGEFRFGTDHPVYVAHAMKIMRRHRHQFAWLTHDANAMLNRPSGWPETRYEAKARKLGHEVWYFRYQKLS